jgi:hypothetical protein
MSTRSISLLILTVALLAGCAMTAVPYLAPTSGPIAYFSVRDLADPSTSTSGVSTYRVADGCRGRVWLQHASETARVTTGFETIVAEQPAAFSIHHIVSFMHSYCVATFQFTPQAGRYYRATCMQTADNCSVLLESSASATFESSEREPVQALNFTNGFDENSSFCSTSPAP